MKRFLPIRHKGTVYPLPIEEICFVKSDNVYVEIFTKQKRYIQRKLLGQIAAELPSNFLRIHRSYIVNMEKVESKEKTHFVLLDRKIPISRKFQKELSVVS